MLISLSAFAFSNRTFVSFSYRSNSYSVTYDFYSAAVVSARVYSRLDNLSSISYGNDPLIAPIWRVVDLTPLEAAAMRNWAEKVFLKFQEKRKNSLTIGTYIFDICRKILRSCAKYLNFCAMREFECHLRWLHVLSRERRHVTPQNKLLAKLIILCIGHVVFLQFSVVLRNTVTIYHPTVRPICSKNQ